MKLKQSPDDFVVEELTDVVPSTGEFALYRLDKTGCNTNDALRWVSKAWRIPWRQFSYGGLKDRHARTTQYVTIQSGPSQDFKQPDVAMTYLGQVPGPFTSDHICANRFNITIRALTIPQLESAQQALAEIAADGLPNYFDDQRFGSVGQSGDFVARQLVLGDFEAGLKLALTAPYEHDRSPAKKEKAIMRRHWGDWAACSAKLSRGPARDVVHFLVQRPTNFRGAITRLGPELRRLYMAAYQSHLWNRLLANWLCQYFPADQLLQVSLQLGVVPMPKKLNDVQHETLQRTMLPLPSARLKLAEDDPLAPVLESVMAQEGLELRQLQIKGIREMFFSKGDRTAYCQPAAIQNEMRMDERHPGKQKLQLGFELQRGSYATLVVKRLLI
jgi:tRNA pseudouridine13 synthase